MFALADSEPFLADRSRFKTTAPDLKQFKTIDSLHRNQDRSHNKERLCAHCLSSLLKLITFKRLLS